MATTTPSKPAAADIYERIEMNLRGEAGSVREDIAEMDVIEMEGYFSDLDPIIYL